MFQSKDDMKEKEITEQLGELRLAAKNATTDEHVLAALREKSKMDKSGGRFSSWIPSMLVGVVGLSLGCGLVFVSVAHSKHSNLTTASTKHRNAQQQESQVHHGNRPKPGPVGHEPSMAKQTGAPAPSPNNKTSPGSKSTSAPITSKQSK